jgi:hypothetical protein
MLKEEKAKRKRKPYSWKRRILIIACILIISLFGCGAYLMQRLAGSPWMDVEMLSGMNGEEIEGFLLEQLPIGTSQIEVEQFIAEHLQPSEDCSQATSDGICRSVQGVAAFCQYWIWQIRFHFDAHRLSKIEISGWGGCL